MSTLPIIAIKEEDVVNKLEFYCGGMNDIPNFIPLKKDIFFRWLQESFPLETIKSLEYQQYHFLGQVLLTAQISSIPEKIRDIVKEQRIEYGINELEISRYHVGVRLFQDLYIKDVFKDIDLIEAVAKLLGKNIFIFKNSQIWDRNYREILTVHENKKISSLYRKYHLLHFMQWATSTLAMDEICLKESLLSVV